MMTILNLLSIRLKLIRSTTAANGTLEKATIAVPLKHLNNFWRSV